MSVPAPTAHETLDDRRVLLVLSTLPDHDSAERLAAALVEAGLAACVNVMAPCTSVYRWQGAVETASEVPVLIKTTAARYAELEAAIARALAAEWRLRWERVPAPDAVRLATTA